MCSTYNKYFHALVALSTCVLLALGSCADDNELPLSPSDPTAEAESVVVPIELTLGATYQPYVAPTTRSAPPGATTDPYDPQVNGEAEAALIDKVRIIAFKRKDTADDILLANNDNHEAEADTINEAEFVYDASNDQTVTCARPTADAHRLVAKASLKKIRGYEYRVIAIAYSSARQLSASNSLLPTDQGEAALFALHLQQGTTLASFNAALTDCTLEGWHGFIYGTDVGYHGTGVMSGHLIYGPQLFYGQCVSAMNNRVIHFRERLANDSIISTSPLTGVLYRGMAKVQVQLTIDNDKTKWVGLMADNVLTQVALNSYDAFIHPTQPITTVPKAFKFGNDAYYTLVDMGGSPSASDLAKGSTLTLTAWLLPTATHLALRICHKSGLIYYPDMYQIKVADFSSAEQGTGIISPDAADNCFYLRRNQRYTLKGNISTLMNNDHQLK